MKRKEKSEMLLEIPPGTSYRAWRHTPARAVSSSHLSTHTSVCTHTPVSTAMAGAPCEPWKPWQKDHYRVQPGLQTEISSLSPLKEAVHDLKFSKLITKLNRKYRK